ncbi:hypothetical protein FKW77_001324 [Venturia effusa]|uniref:Uncharacterized protein n=1 Tax=Venturia effusa TaxID=50376 RepID=A0A517LNC8_9PEZI|nr:hypothetical protein FKW77_001324 [Venturia effusa]
MPGDVDRKGNFRDKRLRVFGDRIDDVVELVERMEKVRGYWLDGLRRGEGGEHERVKGKKAETQGMIDVEGSERGGRGDSEDGKIDEKKGTKKEGLWASQKKYADDIVKLAEEAKVAILRLLASDEAVKVEGKEDGEGGQERMESSGMKVEAGDEDSGFFEDDIDKFLEENKEDTEPPS